MPVPLIAVLLGTVAVLRGLGFAGVDALDDWQTAVRGGLALMFVITGAGHFIPRIAADMVAMIPPRLPYPKALVVVTGVLELAGAAGLLVPATARWAAIGLALMLLAMFPANVYAARQGLTLGGKPVTPLPQRTAEQLVYLALTVIAAI